ncbi:Tumor necrosis factor receptor superfamily member 16 [Liparis tanakae]|uniref:Tumor necrosis factor receptor superfamily member 16 n=1 Tax=Liparis tanakae TaxID=230148 RepID=A0A4Z2GAB9_9TELE|nr:Tumor necrosis factor receptor superfamily member 16 [Liparis tanakae]
MFLLDLSRVSGSSAHPHRLFPIKSSVRSYFPLNCLYAIKSARRQLPPSASALFTSSYCETFTLNFPPHSDSPHVSATEDIWRSGRRGETYSEHYSVTEQCRPCTECTGLMRMETPCTDSNDANCVCNYNFFFDELQDRCEPCTVCPAGQGVFAHCEHDHDTVCEECVDDTYSDRDSSLDPCLPCTICDEDSEIQLGECTPHMDSICHSESATRSGQERSEVGAGRVFEWKRVESSGIKKVKDYWSVNKETMNNLLPPQSRSSALSCFFSGRGNL